MIGIHNLKKLLFLIVSLSEEIATLRGKFRLVDVLKFIDELQMIPAVVANFHLIRAEFDDLTAEERDELLNYIQFEFDLPDDRIEAVIEKGIECGINLFSLIELLRKR